MQKTFKYRLCPDKETEQKLTWTLTRCRELYNACLSERKDSYQLHERTQLQVNPETGQVVAAMMVANQRVKSVTYLQQKRDLVDIKELREEYKVGSYRRKRAGKLVGKAHRSGRWDSRTWAPLDWATLSLPGSPSTSPTSMVYPWPSQLPLVRLPY